MRIDIITIFPGMFRPVIDASILKRAQDKGRVKFYLHNLRDYASDRHKTVDDRPFGGGSGMVLKPGPIFKAVSSLRKKTKLPRSKIRVILLGPQGERFSQVMAKRLCAFKQLILICGHYEGVDERVRAFLADEEISIGDYILTGGELPAMVLADCLVRLLPGVLGDKNSLNFESFEGNLLEYPQYTRPANYRGMQVPAILTSGNHHKIEQWRSKEALINTGKKRPDLFLHKHKRR